MSLRKFEPECSGCLPAIIDVQTGQVCPDDHPLMATVIELWNQQDLPTRKAWHAVTCLNSRQPEILRQVQPFVDQIQAAIAKLRA